jgi:hypothetical protein
MGPPDAPADHSGRRHPQDGFLHPKNLTDTLGFDEPESKCKF